MGQTNEIITYTLYYYFIYTIISFTLLFHLHYYFIYTNVFQLYNFFKLYSRAHVNIEPEQTHVIPFIIINLCGIFIFSREWLFSNSNDFANI